MRLRNRLTCWLIAACFPVLVSCQTEQAPEVSKNESAETPIAEPEPQGTPFAIIETDKGSIEIELLPEVAPETVANFVELAQLGFYSQTAFHRVLAGRMIQGGDPLSRDRNPYNDGQGTSGKLLPQEFSDYPFDRGTVAMGRSPGGGDGGSCQFFIVLKKSPEWEGQYNAFGKVVSGIEVAEEISNVPLSKDPHPSMQNRPAGKQTIRQINIEYRE